MDQYSLPRAHFKMINFLRQYRGFVALGTVAIVVLIPTVTMLFFLSSQNYCIGEPCARDGQGNCDTSTVSGITLISQKEDATMLRLDTDRENFTLFGEKTKDNMVPRTLILQDSRSRNPARITFNEGGIFETVIFEERRVTLNVDWSDLTHVHVSLWVLTDHTGLQDAEHFPRGFFETYVDLEKYAGNIKPLRQGLHGPISVFRPIQATKDNTQEDNIKGRYENCFPRNTLGISARQCGVVIPSGVTFTGEFIVKGQDTLPIQILPYQDTNDCWWFEKDPPTHHVTIPTWRSLKTVTSPSICMRIASSVNSFCAGRTGFSQVLSQEVCMKMSLALQATYPSAKDIGLPLYKSCIMGFSVPSHLCKIINKSPKSYSKAAKRCEFEDETRFRKCNMPSINLNLTAWFPGASPISKQGISILNPRNPSNDCITCSKGDIQYFNSVGPARFLSHPIITKEDDKKGTTYFSIKFTHSCSSSQRLDYLGHFESFHRCENCSSLEEPLEYSWAFCAAGRDPCCPGSLLVTLQGAPGQGMTTLQIHGPFCK